MTINFPVNQITTTVAANTTEVKYFDGSGNIVSMEDNRLSFKHLEFMNDLIQVHHPIRMPDPEGEALYQVHCPACDGNDWHNWSPGDKPVECFYWKKAIDLGLIDRNYADGI